MPKPAAVIGAAWKAFSFGAVVAGAIGPIALLIFGTAASRGFTAGAFAAAGAALADFVYALAAFTIGALVLPLLQAHETQVRQGGALLLIVLGLVMLVRRPAGAAREPVSRASHILLPTFVLTLVNPMTIVMFAGFAPQLPVAGSVAFAAALAGAIGAGSLTVALAVAAAGAILGSARPGRRWQRAIRIAAGAGIATFGAFDLLTG